MTCVMLRIIVKKVLLFLHQYVFCYFLDNKLTNSPFQTRLIQYYVKGKKEKMMQAEE